MSKPTYPCDANRKRPLLLDLFCGAGGAAMGYYRAGFDVVGVDIKPQPRYPFEFIQGDALNPPVDMDRFDAIHASPPCQKYSAATRHLAKDSPKLIEPIRTLLKTTDLPFVIENTPGASLLNPIVLCGLAFPELQVKRHRQFESNIALLAPECGDHSRNYFVVFGHECRDRQHGHVTGRKNNLATGRQAMGIDWMTRGELSQSIPPAYTEFIGRQLFTYLREKDQS